MTSQDHDTDPSTPGAKRFSDPRTPAAAPSLASRAAAAREEAARLGARLARHHTDPGIAPPPEPRPVPDQPMGLVVPPVLSGPSDSVDMLLEGIRREQPDRPRTAPQTSGQAAASYHSEHALHTRRVSLDEEPTVVIDPAAPPFRLNDTAPIERPPLRVDADTQGERAPEAATPLYWRLLGAVLAGLLVVALIFVVLQRTARRDGAGSAGLHAATALEALSSAFTASGSGAGRAVATPSPAPAPTGAPPANESARGPGAGEATAMRVTPSAAASPEPTSAPVHAAKPKAHPPALLRPKPAAGPDDLGEFKTSF